MAPPIPRTVLDPAKAIALWQKGADDWNNWVDKNPDADVSFNNESFSQYRSSINNNTISFNQYNFPNGEVDFRGTKFGDGDVFFHKTTFGEGNVNFSGAFFGEGKIIFNSAEFGKGTVDFSGTTFGKGKVDFSSVKIEEGKVDFSRAKFGDGDVYFSQTTFGDGDVDFKRAKLGKGHITFSNTTFGKGNINFKKATFGEGNITFNNADFGIGNIDFSHTTLGDGNVSFGGATWGEGNVSFIGATFGEGYITFTNTTFGDGNVSFNNATFGKGDIYFKQATFGEGRINFTNTTFKGNAYFSDLKNCAQAKSFSFRDVSFDKAFTISGVFGCVVDLVGTKTSHHMELSGLKCCLQRKSFLGFLKVAKYPEDAARLRRLKELTETNRHHEASLRFHADEMRAKRWNTNETNLFGSCLDMLFDVSCNYGQSIWRPMFGLILLTSILPLVSNMLPNIWEFLSLDKEKDSIKVALANSLPFLSASRSMAISIPSILHQLIALTFIFLIGLGLRNHFRI